MKLNIKSLVKVKLTDEGREKYKETWMQTFGNRIESGSFQPIWEDEYGYSTWQLMGIFTVFGVDLKNISGKYFDPEIIINPFKKEES
jgi:hypothetical protein